MSVFYGTWKQLYHLDTVGFCESDMGAHVWAHVLLFWNSMCVFPQEILPSYKTQDSCELSQHFSSPLDIVYILPDSSLNSAIPQVWLIFISLKWRWCWEKQPKLLTPYVDKQTGNLWVVPVCLLWTPGLHLLLSHDPQSWSKGVPASTSMPGGTSSSRVPDSF